MSKFLLTLALVAVSCVTVHAVSAKEVPLADRLIGTWEGDGKLFGRAATFHMTWKRELGDKFLHLTFRNGMKTPDGVQPILQAQAFYKPLEEGRFEGTWFDSRGVVQPLEAVSEATTFSVNWGSPDTEEGRTDYRILDADRIEVEDYVLKAGEWNLFGEAIYQRAKASLSGAESLIPHAVSTELSFQDLRWLEGDWVRQTKSGEAVESWQWVSDDTMEGIAIVDSGDSTRVTEFLRLERFGEEIFYIAKPNQNAYPTGFRLMKSDEDGVVFENPNHDFPQRIIYTRLGEDALRVHIEATVDGEVQGVDFNFERRK